jgi:hypothetical protein
MPGSRFIEVFGGVLSADGCIIHPLPKIVNTPNLDVCLWCFHQLKVAKSSNFSYPFSSHTDNCCKTILRPNLQFNELFSEVCKDAEQRVEREERANCRNNKRSHFEILLKFIYWIFRYQAKRESGKRSTKRR